MLRSGPENVKRRSRNFFMAHLGTSAGPARGIELFRPGWNCDHLAGRLEREEKITIEM
jgi:hypothetical protein